MTLPPGPSPSPPSGYGPAPAGQGPAGAGLVQGYAGSGGLQPFGAPGPQQYQPPAPQRPSVPARPGVRKVLVWGFVVAMIVVSGLLTAVAIFASTGITGLVVGLVLAVLPVFPLVGAFLWLDRYEAEPSSLLVFAFGWGATVAAFVSIVLNTSSSAVLQQSGGDATLAVWVVAPLVEESSKGLGVVAVLLLRRREFDGVVDGIVYAGMVGIGFAFVENILYFGRAFLESGAAGAGVTFVLRGVFSPFAHPLFTMATGIGIGLAVSRRSPVVKVLAPLCGWVAAVMMHSAWNLGSLTSFQGFVTAYVFLQVPVFLAAVALALLARRREGRLIARHLTVYATTGWLTQSEVRMLASLPDRRQARDWASRTMGAGGRRAMRDFQELASELAFLRERMTRGTAPHDAATTEVALLQTMWQLRRAFLPRRLPTAGADPV
jgi:RsiW-degrading membrane proteinase PrsW (M82 family)